MSYCHVKRLKLSEESTGSLEKSTGPVDESTWILDETIEPSQVLTGTSEELTRPSTEDLQNMLCIKLLKQLPEDFYQSACGKILKIHENFFHLSEMQLQGSAADGYLINGYYIKSDIDFLYSMNIFNPTLEFKKIISDLNSPAHVKIEVIPYFSECETDLKKKKKMANLEYKDGEYFLNLEHIKGVICNQISNRLENSSLYQSVIKSEKNTCFRIEINYDFYKVVRNDLTQQIVQLTRFSESSLMTTEFKENIKQLFYNLSGNILVCQYEWENFLQKLKLKLFTEKNVSSDHYCINYYSRNKTLRQEIVKILNIYFNEINIKMNEILKWNLRHWKCFIIMEYSFYFLLLILINCGLDAIVEIISDKIMFEEYQNIKLEEKSHYYNKFYFTEKEITKIINNISILNEPITQQEKEIEKIFHEFLAKNTIEIKKIIKEWKSEQGQLEYQIEEFLFDRMEDFNEGLSRNKLDWLSSMIKLLLKLLKNFEFFWTSTFSHSTLYDYTIEIVPGLNLKDWPLIASDWITRERYWPEPEIIQRIINNGCHVVFKSLNEITGYDGRLSLSEAEIIMCHAMTRDQTIVYNFIKYQLKSTHSKNLKSYYIKTICFWVFELTPIDNNSKNMQHKYLKDIIKNLCIAIKERTLQHYFLPQHNIFIKLKNEEFDEINKCLWKIDSETYEGQLRFMDDLIMNQETKVSNCFKFVENLFFKLIDDTFKNIIPELTK